MTDNRGYTGHEVLEKLELVHMNGRVYDPLVARFMSADPIIQDLEHSQSYNRYTYVWNNPTNLTDPTGFVGMELEDKRDTQLREDLERQRKFGDPGSWTLGHGGSSTDNNKNIQSSDQTGKEGVSATSANSEVTSVFKQVGSSIKSFFDGGYGDLAGRAQENGDIAEAIGYVGLGTGYAVVNAVMLGQAGAIANSAKELGGVALNQYEGWALQRITNSVVRTFEEDVAVARSFLSPKENWQTGQLHQISGRRLNEQWPNA